MSKQPGLRMREHKKGSKGKEEIKAIFVNVFIN